LSYQMLKPSSKSDGSHLVLKEVAESMPEVATDIVKHLQGFHPYDEV